ncbi:MAG: hypothetical protein O7I93_16300 [Gemmatimonadetes bacterium]|nr:hypothetical protein [Gemmatimonadota bacterium]
MKRRGVAIVPLIAILTMGCEDPIGLDPSDLAGTWAAGSYSWLNKSDLITSYDMILDGGGFVVTFGSDGSYSATRTAPDGTIESLNGTYTVVAPLLTFSDFGGGQPEPFLATRDEDRMTLVTGNVEFDFAGDGTLEPAQLSIFLQR